MKTGDNKASVAETVDPKVDQPKVGVEQPTPITKTKIGDYGVFWNSQQVTIIIAPTDIDEASSKHFGKKIYHRWPDSKKEKLGFKAVFSKYNPRVYRGELGCVLDLNKADTADGYKELARMDLKGKGFIEIYEEDLALDKAKADAVAEIEAVKKKFDTKTEELHRSKEKEFLASKKT